MRLLSGLELGLALEFKVGILEFLVRVELLFDGGLTASQFQIERVFFTSAFSLLTFVEFVTPLPVS